MANRQLRHPCLVKWRKRRIAAEKRGYFTRYEYGLASSWNTCAVGEAHKLNPKLVKYEQDELNGINRNPADSKLWDLGSDFFDCVYECTLEGNPSKKNFKAVDRKLDQIEKRLHQLYVLVEK